MRAALPHPSSEYEFARIRGLLFFIPTALILTILFYILTQDQFYPFPPPSAPYIVKRLK